MAFRERFPRKIHKQLLLFNLVTTVTAVNMAQNRKYLKISLFLKKLPNITDEQFHNHWKTKHVDLAMENSTFVKVTRKYNQVRQPQTPGSAKNGISS